MARGRCTFRQRDVMRAIKAAIAAGCEGARVEIDPAGKIVVVVDKPQEAPPSETTEANEWDRV